MRSRPPSGVLLHRVPESICDCENTYDVCLVARFFLEFFPDWVFASAGSNCFMAQYLPFNVLESVTGRYEGERDFMYASVG